MITRVLSVTFLAAMLVFANLALSSKASGAPPFGTQEDLKYAERLWTAMRDARLVGNQAISAMPYEGSTHKDILITLDSTIRVAGHESAVIVKKMYQSEGISVKTVANKPAANLKIVAVMFQRENGYDSENRDWFYVKFNPDGTPQKNPKGLSLAGQAPKCRTCHQAAPGDDYVYSYDR